ncbi:hypothetical protein L1049_021281 [Liquidambar formosana]|uniref:Uncharacterized protein n=1 Tax=Liquidambar formosana TaxID=63359 RepID=A0AAP0X4Y0_LIQFO
MGCSHMLMYSAISWMPEFIDPKKSVEYMQNDARFTNLIKACDERIAGLAY